MGVRRVAERMLAVVVVVVVVVEGVEVTMRIMAAAFVVLVVETRTNDASAANGASFVGPYGAHYSRMTWQAI